MSDHVHEMLDGALCDFDVAPGAMRWTPPPRSALGVGRQVLISEPSDDIDYLDTSTATPIP